MGLTRYEQEVIINFNAEETTMSVYTADPVWIRKLDRLVESNPKEYSFVRQEECDGKVTSKEYSAPNDFKNEMPAEATQSKMAILRLEADVFERHLDKLEIKIGDEFILQLSDEAGNTYSTKRKLNKRWFSKTPSISN